MTFPWSWLLYARLQVMEHRPEERYGWKIALPIIAFTSVCVVLPFLHYGIPSGHDFEFHMNSWIDVVDYWKQGVIYPHWEAMAHYGYGEARFVFYPPFSWTLGAMLGLALPWKLVPAAYIWVVLTLGGCSMFILARRWMTPGDALWAAAFYAANPYHLVIVYWRSAFAELLSAVYLPILLLLIFDTDERGKDERGKRVLVPLALLFAAGWLTNVPGAVMMHYSAVALIVAVSVFQRSFRPALTLSLAVALGAALAAVYLVPVMHERAWINISQVLGPGVSPQENFLFAFTDDPDHNHFNLLVSIVGVSEIVMVAALLFLGRRTQLRKIWWLITLWSVVCLALMVKPTLPLWMHLPELRFAQLPWRWLLCLNVPLALAIPIALQRWWVRGLICAAALSVVLLTWHKLLVPWWDNSADIQEMLDNQHDGIGNEGTDEYVPAGVDPYEAGRNAPVAKFDGPGTANVHVDNWSGESRTISADTTSAGNLVLRLFNYPSWHVTVNGREVHASSKNPSGQMVVPVPAGESHVRIIFVQGGDKVLGAVISALAMMLAILSFFISRKKARA